MDEPKSEADIKTDADIFSDAQEYVEEHDWTSSYIQRDDGAVCMVGAIICSQGWKYTGVTGLGVEDAHLFDLARLSRKILEVVYRRSFPGDPIRRVTNWNDIYADKQQVLDVLMKAEKQERSGNVVEE